MKLNESVYLSHPTWLGIFNRTPWSGGLLAFLITISSRRGGHLVKLLFLINTFDLKKFYLVKYGQEIIAINMSNVQDIYLVSCSNLPIYECNNMAG